MARVFISFLGLGSHRKDDPASLKCGYRPFFYKWEGHGDDSLETPFAQAAELRLLGITSFDKIVILCTRGSDDGKTVGSYEKHYPLLKKELVESGAREDRILAVPKVSSAPTEEAQWQWFNLFVDLLENGDSIVLDMTHGYRSVQIILSASIGFLRRTKNISLEHVLYASIEQSGMIVDMKNFYEINEWAEAVGRLTEGLDATMISGLAQKTGFKELELLGGKKLVSDMEYLTRAVRSVNVNDVPSAADNLLCTIESLESEGDSNVSGLLLHVVKSTFTDLARFSPLSGRYDKEYFGVQFAVCKTLLKHRLTMQAATAMREYVGSMGMIGAPEEKRRVSTEKKAAKGFDPTDSRSYADVFIKMVELPTAKWKFAGKAETRQRELTRWYRSLADSGIVEPLREGLEVLSTSRNAMAHAWTSLSQKGRNRHMVRIDGDLQNVLCTLRAVTDKMVEAQML